MEQLKEHGQQVGGEDGLVAVMGDLVLRKGGDVDRFLLRFDEHIEV